VFYKKGLPLEGPVPSCEIKTGFKGVAGNKGSVSFSFSIFNSSICVVNCHLAAKKHGIKQRNEDFHKINSNTRYNTKQGIKGIYEHDFVFWIGDLNYRIDDLPYNEIVEAAAGYDFEVLLEKD